MLIFKVSFLQESGRLHWAINRKFQPWSVGVGDGLERGEEDQEFVWQLFESTQRSLSALVLWTAEWELKEQYLQNYICISSVHIFVLGSITLSFHLSLICLLFLFVCNFSSSHLIYLPLFNYFPENMLVLFLLIFFLQNHCCC